MTSTESGDQQLVKTILKPLVFNGQPNFLNILRIPSKDRIPELAKTNKVFLHKIIAAQIVYTMNFFNLRYGLTEAQILHLSDMIIDDAESDNLGVEDVYLFLFMLATGKMGKIYDRLDIPTFMELFEIYREDRHQAFKSLEYEKDQQYKTYGYPERTTIDTEKEMHKSAFSEHLKNQFKP